MTQLQHKVALITGGATGIGFATAQRFIEEGARVFIMGRREAELHNAVARLGCVFHAIPDTVPLGWRTAFCCDGGRRSRLKADSVPL